MLGRKGQLSTGDEPEQDVYHTSIGLIILLGLFIVGGMFVIFSFVDQGEFMEKKTIASNVALYIDAMQLLEGNAFITYFAKDNYTVSTGPSEVNVSDRKGRQRSSFTEDRFREFSYIKFNSRDGAIFEKSGMQFNIKNSNEEVNMHLINCGEAVHDKLAEVTLDAGHGGSDTGNTFQNKKESELTRQIAIRLRASDPGLYKTSVQRLDQDFLVSAGEREIGENLVSIHIGEENPDFNIKAYVLSNEQIRESRLMACLILNELTNSLYDKYTIKGAAIIPLNPDALDKDWPATKQDEADPRTVLLRSKTGVVLEIGGINQDILAQIPAMTEAINKGIMKYGVERVVS